MLQPAVCVAKDLPLLALLLRLLLVLLQSLLVHVIPVHSAALRPLQGWQVAGRRRRGRLNRSIATSKSG